MGSTEAVVALVGIGVVANKSIDRDMVSANIALSHTGLAEDNLAVVVDMVGKIVVVAGKGYKRVEEVANTSVRAEKANGKVAAIVGLDNVSKDQ